MIWNIVAPHGAEDLGLLPEIFTDADPRPAAEQAADRYAHGGGWDPQPRWKVDRNTGVARYPGDPVLRPIAWTQMNDEMLFLYQYGYVCVMQRGGAFEMARLD